MEDIEIEKMIELVHKYGISMLCIENNDKKITIKNFNKSSLKNKKNDVNTENENLEISSKKFEQEEKIVKAPLVGIFYSAPSSESKNYVEVGDCVIKGQVLAIIEAMKLMNEIKAEQDGVIEDILVENGQMVEFGQPLFIVK